MFTSTQSKLARHAHAVQQYIASSQPRYAALLDPASECHPIPCFGNPDSALAVTVGLNPSATEFTAARSWAGPLTSSALADRCSGYFSRTASNQSHPWFAPWSDGLASLGLSYEACSAVHLDLSPRATRSVSSLRTAGDRSLFLTMVQSDLWVFFATLQLCQAAKLVLLAGSVTGKYYLNEFLQRFAPAHSYSLDRPFTRRNHPGKGKTSWHWLSGPERRLPVFFCSSSPSDRPVTLLPQRIKENATTLKNLLNGAGPTALPTSLSQ
ncbi:MAG TPA: hypothetical protein VGW37_05925 [Terriglobia bacterium]|nr:hypothetical protein [Terriglobia bacterium]